MGSRLIERCRLRNLSGTFNSSGFIFEFITKLESRQVSCGSVRNISHSSSLGLFLAVGGWIFSPLLPKMLQSPNLPNYFPLKFLLSGSPPSSLWNRKSIRPWGHRSLKFSPQNSVLEHQWLLAHTNTSCCHRQRSHCRRWQSVGGRVGDCHSEQGATGCLV